MLSHPEVSPRTWRPVIMGKGGAVASNHPLATLAGYDVLRAGGNAADAAVAVATSLGVVEPYMSGMGGDAFYLVYQASARKATVINASGSAPGLANAERFHSGIPQNGILSTSMPCAVDGWLELQRRFGATQHYCNFVREALSMLVRDPGCARTYLLDGEMPHLGTVIRNPALARTLEQVMEGGREAFYAGATAHALAGFFSRSGGPIDSSDLAGCRCEAVEPIQTTYRGLTILEAPPNSMGFTLLEELNIVESFDLGQMGYCSADLTHTLVEAKKLAFLDRERYAGDPRFNEVPLERILGKDYARELAARINPKRASTHATVPAIAGDTTFFAVVDGNGNAVSGIQSLGNLFGSGVMDPTTGVLFNNRMHT